MSTIHIAGRLGANPETRVTPKGIKVTSFSVAETVYYAGKEETVWWRVTVWNDDFKSIMDHLKKGSAVMIVGEMRGKPQTYVDKKTGETQVSLEITAISVRFSPFGSPDKAGQEGGQTQRPANNQPQPYQNTYGNTKEPAAANVGSSYGESTDYAEDQDDDKMPF